VIEMIAGMTLEKLQTLTEPKLQLVLVGRRWRRRDPEAVRLTSSSW